MALKDRFKRLTGANEENYEDSYDDDYYAGLDNSNFDDVGSEDDDMQYAQPTQNVNTVSSGSINVNTAPSAGGISLSGANIKMQVVRPEKYDSETAGQIADLLLNKCTVVLNLEKTNKEASKRLIDFLLGVTYSIDGTLKRIALNAYVITPSNVEVGDSEIKRAAPAPAPQPEPEPAKDNFSAFDE